MICFYWPGKAVPEWLESVKVRSGTPPTLTHNGIGVIFKRAGSYHVHHFAGDFMVIRGAAGAFEIQGGGDGVFVHYLSLSAKCALAFAFGLWGLPIITRWLP